MREPENAPRGYVEAMSKGQPWRSEDGFLNATLVSVLKRAPAQLSLATQRFDFKTINDGVLPRKIFVSAKEDKSLVASVTIRKSSAPRVAATMLMAALTELVGGGVKGNRGKKPTIPARVDVPEDLPAGFPTQSGVEDLDTYVLDPGPKLTIKPRMDG